MVDELKSHGVKDNIISWTRGVDRSVFKSSLRIPASSATPILLYVGRVSKEKNIDDFCKLDFHEADKIVVGDGPYRKELENRYPNVIFVGSKKGEELASYYANADVFVFPSRTDTFGIVIIESLAVGTPVAAYQVAGPIDILDSGITGYMATDINGLRLAISKCMQLNRREVEIASNKWTWVNCWNIFRDSLIPIS